MISNIIVAGKPDECTAITELEVELITGRTHQIRGQFAALGCPLVGDVQYGGAVPSTSVKNNDGRSERLALQCSALEFLDPMNSTENSNAMRRSDKWNSFHLDTAFWSPYIEQYVSETTEISLQHAKSLSSEK